jgi:capsid protein
MNVSEDGKVGLVREDAPRLPLVVRMSDADIKRRIDAFFHDLIVSRLNDSPFEGWVASGLKDRVERAVRAQSNEIDVKVRAAVSSALDKLVARTVAEQFEVVVEVEIRRKEARP